MVIMDLVISGVGKFSKPVKFTFHKGYNVVYGLNESGKSAFARAIMAVLFPDVYSNVPDFINWNLEGTSRCHLTVSEGKEIYRLVRDFTQKLSNLSRYVKDKKAFALITKDEKEIAEFINNTLKLSDEEIYSSAFFSDAANLPSTSPLGYMGAVPKPIKSEPSAPSEGDYDLDGQDPSELKERLEMLKGEMARAKEISEVETAFDEEQSNLYDIQTQIKDIRDMEVEITEIGGFINKFKAFGEVEGVVSRVDKYAETERRLEGTMNELRSKKGQAEAELANSTLPSIQDHKLFFPGIGIAVLGIVLKLPMAQDFLSRFVSSNTVESISKFAVLVLLAGLGMAGWVLWQFVSAVSYQSKLRSTILKHDDDIKQLTARYNTESREIKELMKSLGADNIEALKTRVRNYKESMGKKEALEKRLVQLKEERGYDKLVSEETAVKSRVDELQQKLEGMHGLGFTPQEMTTEIRRIEGYLAKRGVRFERYDEAKPRDAKSGGFGGGGKKSRFPEDHFARHLAIATELVQKGQMEPLGELQKIFNKYIQELTNNQYARATFSSDGVIKFLKADNLMRVGMDSMSLSTKDTVYFALKLALIDAIIKRKSIPIIMDDPFILFDDQRVAAVVSILKELSSRAQVILLTTKKAAAQGANRSFQIK